MPATDQNVLRHNLREELGHVLSSIEAVLSASRTISTAPGTLREHVLALLESTGGSPQQLAELCSAVQWSLPGITVWLEEHEELRCGHSQLDACGCTWPTPTRREVLWG